MEAAEVAVVPQLNDDCWLHIFSFLPMRDLIRSERVCKRWQRIVLMTRKTITITSSEYLVFENILQKHEKSMVKLKVYKQQPNHFYIGAVIFELIDKYSCNKLAHLEVAVNHFSIDDLSVEKFSFLKNLKFLSINVSDDFIYEGTYTNIKNFLDKFDNLKNFFITSSQGTFFITNLVSSGCKELFLNRINIDRDFNWEQLSKLFLKMTDYKKGDKLALSLMRISNFYLDDLKPISNELSRLDLTYMSSNCFVRSGENFLKSIPFQNLKEFAITDVDVNCINDDIILTLVRKCPLLEFISVYEKLNNNITNDGYRYIANLKELKWLGITSKNIKSETFEYIAANCSKLERIGYPNEDLNLVQLVSIVNSLPKLHSMTLKGFEKLTNPCLKSILEIVRGRKNNVKLTLGFWECIETDLADRLILKDKQLFPDLINDYVTITVSFEDTGKYMKYFVVSD